MKWCRYTANGSTSYGTIEGDTVHEISGSPFGEHCENRNDPTAWAECGWRFLSYHPHSTQPASTTLST